MSDTKLPTTLPAFLLHFMKRRKWGFILLFISTVAHIAESNVLPYALKMMVDTAAHLDRNTSHVLHAFAWPVGLFIAMWVLMIVVWRIQERIGVTIRPAFEADIRMRMLAYVQDHSYDYFSNNFAGTIAGKIGDMPRAAYNMFEFLRWRVMSTFWVALVAVFMLGTVNLSFSLVLALWVAVHLFISFRFARKVAAYSHHHSDDQNVLKGHIVDLITNMATARLFARKSYEQNYVGKSQSVEKASYRKVLYEMMLARITIDVPLIIMYCAMLVLLVKGWQAGWVGPGDMVFVMFTVFNVMGLAWQLGTELPNFFNEMGVATQALTLINRPHGVVDAADAKPLLVTRGEIVFDDVHFHYVPGRDIFRDKNITIRPGEKVGLVGFSGSGKSTFVNLILRLYDVEGGRILIDGQNIAQVTQDSLREHIGMIPQDATLFHRTLMENIRYGREDATDAEVIEASKRAHCDEFIGQLPEGYSSLVGERGIKLSGGQRQRIAIARAILKNAPILILDEATSSLDSVTEKYIQESLHRLMADRTAIVIAHRLSTLSEMDRILVFKDGAISEDGCHQSLLAADGHYAMLWRMQAGGFLPDDVED